MKRTLVSAALVAAYGLVAGPAAAAPAGLTSAQMVAVTTAGTNVLFLSGATAPQQTLIDTIQTNICQGVFTRMRTSAGNSAKYQAWGCTDASNNQVVIYYTTLGSSWGVQPVLFGGTGRSTPRIDPSKCTVAAGATSDSCPGLAAGAVDLAGSIPDVGVSDTAASAFVGPNVPDNARLVLEFPEVNGAPFNAAGGVFEALTKPFSGTVAADPVQGVVFGIAVSNTLATAMGGAANKRDSSAPNLPKNVVSSIWSGKLAAADDIDAILGVDSTGFGGSTRYVVCRRVQTSGTWTFANVYWLNNGTFPDQNATVPAANSTSWPAFVGGDPSPEVAYVNNTTSGNVRTCMNRANNSGLFAIGVISAENDNNAGAAPSGTANTWSFAKLNGVPMEDTTDGTQANNLTNAKSGLYDYVGEVMLNRRGNLAGVKGSMYTTLRNNLRGSAVCTIGASIATGALQMAGAINGAATCATTWSREGDPFTTPKLIP